MNYKKHLIYRHILVLLDFRSVYTTLTVHLGNTDYSQSPVKIFEVTKVCDNNGKYEKYISFLLSSESLPRLDDFGLFDVTLHALTMPDINRYIHECKEYGMHI